jgi:hypothetical protein
MNAIREKYQFVDGTEREEDMNTKCDPEIMEKIGSIMTPEVIEGISNELDLMCFDEEENVTYKAHNKEQAEELQFLIDDKNKAIRREKSKFTKV